MGAQAKRSPLHALAAESPSFSYASSAKKAVEDASIFLSKCDIILLFWPNGCGKSALSRLFSGLYQPQLRKVQPCKQSETLLNLFAMQQQTEPADSFFVHIRILAVAAWHYAALP